MIGIASLFPSLLTSSSSTKPSPHSTPTLLLFLLLSEGLRSRIMIIDSPCSRRSSLLSLRRSDSALRSPIQRLPPEILGIIFCHTLPSKCDFIEPSLNTAPLLLGRVCKHWRELAERTPELWTSISMFLLRPYERATRAFERWISRSGSCPLRIKLVVMTYTPSPSSKSGDRVHSVQKDTLREFVRSLAKQSYRWLVADISVPGCFMQTLLANEAPMLRKLTLSDPLVEPDNDVSYTWEHTFALSAAPALEQLVLKQRLRILPVTTHPITSVQFDAFTSSQVVDLFNGCPMLEELGISFRREILLLEGPEIWAFPRMHTLRIVLHHSNSRAETSAILDRLRLPSLRTLTIDGLRQSHGLHLCTLLDRTSGGLTSLTLLNISTSHNDMFEYLHRTPHLRSLRLVDSHGFDYRCVRKLTWLPGLQTNVCPRLSELWLLRSECQMLMLDMVELMVVSRSLVGGGVCARHGQVHSARHANAGGCPGIGLSASAGTGKKKSMGTGPRDANGTVGDHRSQMEIELVPVPLKEFRFDGSRYQHEELLARPKVRAAIESGLVWKR